MPKVLTQGKTIGCVDVLALAKPLVEKPLVEKPLVPTASLTAEEERLVVRHRCANLRKILLHNNIHLYNGGASSINCRAIGTCGSCAVKVETAVSAANWRDNARRWSLYCQAFSFIKRLSHSFATGQPLLEQLGNKTRKHDRFLPILLHQTYV